MFLARDLLENIPERPFSFEVFSGRVRRNGAASSANRGLGRERVREDSDHQHAASELGRTGGALGLQGVKVNVTAMMTMEQVDAVLPYLEDGPPSYLSICGRARGRRRVRSSAADVRRAGAHARASAIELIWAQPRELFNIVQADTLGCHIITVTHDLLKKAADAGQGPG